MVINKKRLVILTTLLLIFVIGISFFLLNKSEAVVSNGSNAVNVIGQYGDGGAVDYTKAGANNGPNKEGFNTPNGFIVDGQDNLAFVIDQANNRILVHQLDAANLFTDYEADYVLGQADFSSNDEAVTASQSNFSNPSGLAVDPGGSRLFVSDSGFNRILIFDVGTMSDNMTATYVLGQADFVSSDAATTQAGLSAPEGLYYDETSGLLYVADKTNNRVLIYDATYGLVSDGMNSSYVLGQADFVTSTAATTTVGLSGPTDVSYYDANDHLFIADEVNNRIIIHSITLEAPLIDGRTADKVFGQSDFVSAGSGSGAAQFSSPFSVSVDASNDRLMVADYDNNRIQSFDITAIDNNENAANSLTSLTTKSLYYYSGAQAIFASELNEHRVAKYDAIVLTPGESPIEVIGQVDGAGDDIISTDNGVNNGANKKGFSTVNGVAVDTTGHRLFVSDKDNDRVLVYNLDANDELVDYTPDNILGKTDFYDASQTDVAGLTPENNITQPGALVYDPNNSYLFVADDKRVLVFDVASITDGEAAINVLCQVDFASQVSITAQGGVTSVDGLALNTTDNLLFVSNGTSNRVLVFDVSSISDGENAINVLGQGGFGDNGAVTTQAGLSGNKTVAYDSANDYLFVADTTNNRVIVYDVSTIANGEDAVAVLGQSNYTGSTAGTDQNSLSAPSGLSVDAVNKILHVADASNNRVVTFDVATVSNGELAKNVLGQSGFATATAATSQAGLESPNITAYNSGSERLFVGDLTNNRIMVFDVSETTNTAPTAPSLSSPANTATEISVNPTIQFSTTDVDSDKLFYELELASAEEFYTVLHRYSLKDRDLGWSQYGPYASGASASFTLPNGDSLSTNATYYWRVRAIDANGAYSSYSSVRSFTTVAHSLDVNYVDDFDTSTNLDTTNTTAYYYDKHKISIPASNTIGSQSSVLGAGKTAAIVAFDADSDGDIDMAVKNVTGVNSSVYLNNGSGTFSGAGGGTLNDLSAATNFKEYLFAVDVDLDGNIDVLDRGGYVYANDGAGTFTASDAPRVGAVGDLNNDGYIDLIEPKQAADEKTYLYINDGDGNFNALSPNPFDALTSNSVDEVYILDINNDSWMDVVTNNTNGTSNLFLNDGDLTFTSSTPWAALVLTNMEFTDLDGDGDVDLFGYISGTGFGTWLSDGKGLFSSRTAVSGNCKAYNLHSADIDTDGDQDIVCAGGNGDSQNYYWRNKGDGTFETETAAFGTAGTSTIITADVDGDGDLDFLVGNGDGGEDPVVTTQNYLYTTSGGRGIVKTTLDADVNVRGAFDSDNDGDIDLYVTTTSNDTGVLWINDGDQAYTVQTGFSDYVYDVATVDVDNDGDLDLVEAGVGTRDQLWINNGSNSFTSLGAVFGSNAYDTEYIRSGDLNNDGYLDFLFLYSEQIPEICLNDGDGTTYTCANVDTSVTDTRMGADFADVNNDGILDLFINYTSDVVTLYTGDGDGTFTSSVTFSSDNGRFGVGDLDGDGDVDVLMGIGSLTSYLNNGSGTFTSDVILASCNNRGYQLSDLDGDGDLDVVVACGSTGSEIWENHGHMSFVKQAALIADGGQAVNFLFSDYDLDGDVDLWSIHDADGDETGYRFDQEQTYTASTDYNVFSGTIDTIAGGNLFRSAEIISDDYTPSGASIAYYLSTQSATHSLTAHNTGVSSDLYATQIFGAIGNAVYGTALGDGGSFRYTEDSGDSWIDYSYVSGDFVSGVLESIYDSIEVDESTGSLYVGSGGFIYDDETAKSEVCLTDGARLVSNDLNDLSSYSVGSNTIVYAAGDSGVVVRLNLASYPTVSCSALSTGVSVNLNGSDIIAGDQTDIVVVGDKPDAGNGTILTSVNSGGSWTSRVSGVAQNLNDVAADQASNLIIAVGDNGTILKSTDAGVNWTAKTSGTAQNINAVALKFEDSTEVWAAAENDTILLSSDSGDTWTVLNTTSGVSWNDIEEKQGAVFVVGDSGKMVTYDGYGTPWEGPIVNESLHSFSTPGALLQWKAVMSTTDVNNPPVIRDLSIDYNSTAPASPVQNTPENTPDNNPPAEPLVGATQVLTSDSIQWTFIDNSNNEQGFRLYDVDGVLISQVDTAGLAFITENMLTANTQYNRFISAFNDNGESALVDLGIFYTLAAKPIIGSIYVTDENSVNIEFSENGNPAETLYAIYESTTSQWVQINGKLGATRFDRTYDSWVDNGVTAVLDLTNGQTYTFSIVAKNGVGEDTEYSTAFTIEVVKPAGASVVISKKVGINVTDDDVFAQGVFFGTPVYAYGGKAQLLKTLPFYSEVANGYLVGSILFLIIFIIGLIFNSSDHCDLSEKLRRLKHTPKIVLKDWRSKHGDEVYDILNNKEAPKIGEKYKKHHRLYRYTSLTMICLAIGIALKIIIVGAIFILVYTNLGVQAFINQSGEPVYSGDELVYHVDFVNNGQSAAENLVISDNIPAGVSYITGSVNLTGSGQSDVVGDDKCSVTSGNVVCEITSLGVGGSGYIEFQTLVTGAVEDTIVNLASATYKTLDLPRSSNSVSNQIQEKPIPACSDGVDNDGDNLADYPFDYGCTDESDDTENSDIFVARGLIVDINVSGDWRYVNMMETGVSRFIHRSSSHKVTLVNADKTGNKATLKIESDPITVDVSTGTTVLVDSDGNGIKDLNLTVLAVISEEQAVVGLQAVTEQVYQCNDKKDNDADSLIDYPQDPGCSSLTDNDEYNAPKIPKPEIPKPDVPKPEVPTVPTPPEETTTESGGGTAVYECSDGIDNDGDGLFDYPEDTGCSDVSDTSEIDELIPDKTVVAIEDVIKSIDKELESLDEQIAVANSTMESVSLNIQKTTKQIQKVSVQTAETVVKSVQFVNEKVLNDPRVEAVTSEVAIPTMITFTAVGAVNVATATASAGAGAVGGLGMLSYLQYFAIQPLLLFTRKKRERWGVIYDSITKKPIPLAIVRIYDKNTGRLIRTKVSDKNGRYQFIVDSGEYYIEVSKDQYKFPSEILYGQKQDDKYYGLYYGHTIVADEKLVLNYNVPVDPDKKAKAPAKEIRSKIFKQTQYVFSMVGPIGALISLIVEPAWWVAVLLIVQLFLIYSFRKVAIPAKLKNWGVVVDQQSGKPINRAVVRIFDAKYNKLLESQITGRKGRYGFLVTKNEYYLTVTKDGYGQYKSENIPVVDEEGGLITKTVELKKGMIAPPQDDATSDESMAPIEKKIETTAPQGEKEVE